MKELTLEEIKSVQLDLLDKFDSICRDNRFRYSLGGGSLLGAVRHKGYIPWDDDIDVMMPRPDYDKFVEYCLSNDINFGIRCFDTDKEYTDLSAKIYDKHTIVDTNGLTNESGIGVAIDIFVIDGLGSTLKKARKAFNETSFKRELLVASQWKRFFRSKTHSWYVEPIRFVFFVLSRFVNKAKIFNKVQNTYKRIDFDQSEFAAAVGGSYREKEILPQSVFTDYIELPFEDRKYFAIERYDEYLTSIYGDYMELPPEEKRASHHLFKAYYLGEDENE